MNELAKVSASVLQARTMLGQITERVAAAEDASQVLDAKQRINLAREWVKIHKVAAETHVELLRLEVVCLVRIVELEAVNLLPNSARNPARYFAALTEIERGEVLAKYAACSTAVGIARAVQRDDMNSREWTAGREFAERPEASYDEPEIEAGLLDRRCRSARAAMAAILERHIDDRSVSVDELTAELIEDTGVDDYFRRGVAEVAREAIRSGPTLTINRSSAPRFVTVEREGEFLRVPFHNATLGQLSKMVRYRRVQIDQDVKAADRLDRLVEYLDDYADNWDEPLSQALARVAVPVQQAT